MRKMKRYFVAPLLLVFMLAFCVQYYAGKMTGLLLDDEILGALLLLIGLSIYSIVMAVRHWQYRKKGEELPAPDRRGKVVRWSVLAALLLAEGVLILVRQGQSWEKPIDEAELSYVSLADVEGAELSGERASRRFDNTASFETSWAVPVQYDLRMSGQTADGFGTTMQVCLYEASSERVAASLFEAIMAKRQSWNQILMQWEIEADVDEAYAAGYMGFQYLFLREGKRMVTVYYYGRQDLTEKAGLFAGMLR